MSSSYRDGTEVREGDVIRGPYYGREDVLMMPWMVEDTPRKSKVVEVRGQNVVLAEALEDQKAAGVVVKAGMRLWLASDKFEKVPRDEMVEGVALVVGAPPGQAVKMKVEPFS